MIQQPVSLPAMDIVNIQGGLGNQMFQYAFFCSLHDLIPDREFYINLKGILNFSKHNGYELDRLFRIGQRVELPYCYVELIRKLKRKDLFVVSEVGSSHYQSFNGTHLPIRFFDGYWQTELYFKKIESQVRATFSFNEALLNERTRAIAGKIRSQQTVSIHIRRGDYFENEYNHTVYGNVCTCEYYHRAIATLRAILPGDFFIYLFSDEPEWVRANIHLENSLIIDWNRGMDSWQDMYLISLCRHNIMANSSFSWWGAWLNASPDKIVVAPSEWYHTKPAPDIIPEGWIRI